MGRKRIITDETIEQIRALRQEGMTYLAISARMEMSRSTVVYYCRDLAQGESNAKLGAMTIERIRSLRQEGRCYSAIARECGVVISTIAKYASDIRPEQRKTTLSDAEIQRIRRLRNQGKSHMAIRATTGHGLSTIAKYCRDIIVEVGRCKTLKPKRFAVEPLPTWIDLPVGCRVCNADIVLKIRREGAAQEWRYDSEYIACPSCNTCFHVADLMPIIPKIGFVY